MFAHTQGKSTKLRLAWFQMNHSPRRSEQSPQGNKDQMGWDAFQQKPLERGGKSCPHFSNVWPCRWAGNMGSDVLSALFEWHNYLGIPQCSTPSQGCALYQFEIPMPPCPTLCYHLSMEFKMRGLVYLPQALGTCFLTTPHCPTSMMAGMSPLPSDSSCV